MKDTNRSTQMYTKEERAVMLKKMHHASRVFYEMAQKSGCHTFIELTGFMNEYIKLCQLAQEKDIDFTQSNVHTQDVALPMEIWHAEYLGEKFSCIFAASFAAKPKLLEAFINKMKEG